MVNRRHFRWKLWLRRRCCNLSVAVNSGARACVIRRLDRLWFRTTTCSIHIYNRKWIRRTIGVQHHRWIVVILSQMKFQRVTVLGSIWTVGASILIDVRVRFKMAVKHGFVHTWIRTLAAFERFRAKMIPQVIFQMMFIFGDERTLWARQELLSLNMTPTMLPELEFSYGYESTLFAFKSFHFALRIQSWNSESRVLVCLLSRTFALICHRCWFRTQLVNHRF